MKINDTLNELFKSGHLNHIVFAKTEQGNPIITAEQVLKTAKGGTTCRHQTVGEDFEEALEEMQKVIAQCAPLHNDVKILRR